MFKNLIVYRLSHVLIDLLAAETALAAGQYVEASPGQERSAGWIPPRGEKHGPMVESIGGHWILKYMTEVKTVPGAVLARKAKERAEQIEQATGRKPGKKETKEIKEEIRQSLLPMAFSKQAASWVWIDRDTDILAIDAGTQTRADEVVTALVKAIDGLSLALLDTQTSPMSAMAEWLSTQEPPAGFSIDHECELKASDESKAVVRYGRHPLDIEEVKQHIAQGKLPTKLALTWDDRVSFVLTHGLQIKKLAFLDVVFEGRSADDGGFDADAAIATGELSQLLLDLIDALGGEAKRQP